MLEVHLDAAKEWIFEVLNIKVSISEELSNQRVALIFVR